jgi:hypothetical protein
MPSLRAAEREPYWAIDRFPIRTDTLPFRGPGLCQRPGLPFHRRPAGGCFRPAPSSARRPPDRSAFGIRSDGPQKFGWIVSCLQNRQRRDRRLSREGRERHRPYTLLARRRPAQLIAAGKPSHRSKAPRSRSKPNTGHAEATCVDGSPLARVCVSVLRGWSVLPCVDGSPLARVCVSVLRGWSVLPCVRPVDAAHMCRWP